MTASTLASSRRRTTFVAVALALVIGTVALVAANGPVAPAAANVPVVSTLPAPDPATDALATSPDKAVEAQAIAGPVAGTPEEEAAIAAADADPTDDVFLVAVDPADALLADNGDSAVSN